MEQQLQQERIVIENDDEIEIDLKDLVLEILSFWKWVEISCNITQPKKLAPDDIPTPRPNFLDKNLDIFIASSSFTKYILSIFPLSTKSGTKSSPIPSIL